MADIVKIRVSESGAKETLIALQSIESAVKKINETKITVDVDKTTARVLSAQAKIIKSNNDLAISANKLAEAQAKANAQNVQETERTKRALAQLETWHSKEAIAQQRTALQTEKTATVQAQAALQANNLADGQKRAAKSAGEHASAQKWLAAGLGSVISRLEHNAWQLFVRNMREALETIKDMDSEMATYRKITNASKEETRALEEQLYKTATAYGVLVTDIAQTTTAFAQAGYKEQSAALGELATKTQLVGDMTADSASSFLIAVDAAYKMHGSVTELGKVLDGINVIENTTAARMSEIAGGLGLVASVAENAGINVDELSAALGTLIAVTQRSGTENARAFRAIVLNILGDTQTVLNEDTGEKLTYKEVEKAKKAMSAYATEAYKAAAATGENVDVMAALGEVAEKYEQGLISESELTQLAMEVGGKLRSNQFTVLIKNFDMYKQNLDNFAEAAGSADSEVSVMLDTWEAKSNQLKNTWTEVVNNTLNSDFVKRLLDVANNALKAADNLGVLLGNLGGIALILKSGKIASNLTTILQALGVAKGAGAAGVLGVSGGAVAGLGVGAVVITGLIAAYNAYNKKLKENQEIARQDLESLNARTTSLQELKQEYLDIVNSEEGYAVQTEKLNTWKEKLAETYGIERDRLAEVNLERQTGIDLINEEILADRDRWEIEHRDEYEKAKSKIEQGYGFTQAEGITDLWPYSTKGQSILKDSGLLTQGVDGTYSIGVAQGTSYTDTKKMLEGAITRLQDMQGRTADESALLEVLKKKYKEVNEVLDTYGTTYDAYNAYLKLAEEREKKDTAAIKEGNTAHAKRAERINDFGDVTKSVRLDIEELNADLEIQSEKFSSLNTEIDNIQSAYTTLTAAVQEYNDEGYISVDTFQSLLALGPEYLDLLSFENGQLVFNKDAYYALTAAKIDDLGATMAMQIADAAYLAALSGDMSQLEAYKGTLDDTTASIWEMVEAKLADIDVTTEAGAAAYALARERLDSLRAYMEAVKKGLGKGLGNTGGGGGGRGTSTATKKDEELERLKDIVSLRKQELSYIKESGGTTDEQIAKQREIQEALHNQAEHLRSVKADEEDILKLSTEWWNIQNEINKLIMEAVNKQIDDQIAALNETDELENKRLAVEETRLAMEEKRTEMLKAQNALLDAQNERTVRIFNAEKNRWEWVANAKNVQSAQESLQSARQGYQDAAKGHVDAYNEWRTAERVAALEAQRAAIQTAIMGDGAGYATLPGNIAAMLTGAPKADTSSYSTYGMSAAGTNYSDSHDNHYLFNGVTISDAEANAKSLSQLARQLRGLAITNNM